MQLKLRLNKATKESVENKLKERNIEISEASKLILTEEDYVGDTLECRNEEGTILIYAVVYTHKINQRIQSGEVAGRRLVDIPKMVMIEVIIGLVIFSGILMYVVNDYANAEQHISRNNYAVIDVSDENAYKYAGYFGNVRLEDATFAKVYNKEENAGYEKKIEESGPFRYSIFTRTSVADSFHPDFLCFVEYIGDKKGEYSCYEKTGFCSITEENDYFYAGNGGEDIPDNLLYIGNIDAGCRFDITLSLMDKEAERKYEEASEQNPECEAEEYATEMSKVSIVVE